MEFTPRVKRGGFSPEVATREFNNVMRDVMYSVAVYWHTHFRPKHFTHAGASEYGYAERNPFYNLYKFRRFGHTYPLVFSGRSLIQTGTNVNITATATSKRARSMVKMRAPKLNLQNPRSPIIPSEELRRVSPREIQTLHSIARNTLNQRFRLLRAA